MTGIPYDEFEGFIKLFFVSIIIVIFLLISKFKNLKLEKDFLYSIFKGSIQLFVLALFLTFIFESPLWHLWVWLLLIIMIIISGNTSSKRAEIIPKAISITIPSILLGSASVMMILAISSAMPLRPEFIIPIGGMVFGNSMNICSLTLDRLVREVKTNKDEIEAWLALGAEPDYAIRNHEVFSTRASLIPTIDNLKTLGIIFIPGAMTGLIMAGTPPLLAAQFQIIIFLILSGGGIISSVTANHMARKKIFNRNLQLSDWIYELNP